MTGTKEKVARGEQRRGGKLWEDMQRISEEMRHRGRTMGTKKTLIVVK